MYDSKGTKQWDINIHTSLQWQEVHLTLGTWMMMMMMMMMTTVMEDQTILAQTMGKTTVITHRTIIVGMVEMVDEHHQVTVEDQETHQGITIENHAVTQCLHPLPIGTVPQEYTKQQRTIGIRCTSVYTL
jgi:hypothetical protein